MAKELLALRDFPPFVRFELEERLRRKIFAAFANRVAEAEVGIHPEIFWRSVEEEFERSRYELIFGTLSGTVLHALERGPLEAKELLERNPKLSPYSIYHALVKLKHKQLIHKKDGRWELRKGHFEHLSVSELAKIIDLRQRGCRRKNALSMTDVQMATYLWPEYGRAADRAGTSSLSATYGRYYGDHFALARAVKEWARGDPPLHASSGRQDNSVLQGAV
ncbi:MAG: hypothetical protein EFT35_04310 [Methanophagales archaeon ANME-1-THS]|nr:MAG: hypothetical protein EFT35_04310 [Methanophagales archaeon ANME-1-THS]